MQVCRYINSASHNSTNEYTHWLTRQTNNIKCCYINIFLRYVNTNITDTDNKYPFSIGAEISIYTSCACSLHIHAVALIIINANIANDIFPFELCRYYVYTDRNTTGEIHQIGYSISIYIYVYTSKQPSLHIVSIINV